MELIERDGFLRSLETSLKVLPKVKAIAYYLAEKLVSAKLH
jgi:hypothetical protein